MALRTGKLPPQLLERLLKHRGAADMRVLLGPSIGEDAAVVRLGKQLLVLKTDPVTYASDMIGWYAVNINANDVATRGAKIGRASGRERGEISGVPVSLK